MTDLGSTERRLLRALRAADEPSDDDRARVRARVLLKVAAASGVASALATTAANAPGAAAAAAGTAAGTASVAPGAAATATTLGFAAGSWKIGAAIVTVVGAVSGAAWIATSPKADPPASVAPQTAGQSVQQTKPALRPETPSAGERENALPSAMHKPPRNRTRPADPPASAEQKPDELESELLLLENAQQALKQGDSERALAALDQHASEHPGGALASERAGVRAVALCESGKTAEGRREARRFLSRNPKSPLAVRVRAACLDTKK